jgi:hypothetical protein
VNGKIDGADAFDGVDDHFTLPRVYTSENQFTMEAWIYAQTGARYFISERSTTSQGVLIQLTGDFLQYYINGISDGRSITLNTWNYVVLTYAGSTANLYVNGAVRIKACTPPTWPSEGMYLGDRSAGGRQFHGTMDEVRFSNIARNNGWITTCYNNQNNPSSFYTVGNEEVIPSGPPGNNPPTLTNPTPADGSTGVPIATSKLSVMIKDPEGEYFNWTITTSPNIGSKAENHVHNGTKNCTISGLTYSTTYTWTVKATDGHNWTV